jgi:uncharacterized protein (DUF433 family)
MAIDWRERIVVDSDVLSGKPIVKGTRLAVDFILSLLAEGWSIDMILSNYSQLTKDDISAVLSYAVELLRVEKVYPAK